MGLLQTIEGKDEPSIIIM